MRLSRQRLYVLNKYLAITLIIALFSNSPTSLTASVPAVKYQTVTWVDDVGVWIVDISLSTESPWIMGRVISISVNTVLRSSPPNSSLYMVVRVLSGNTEISSKYIGELSERSMTAAGYLHLVVSNLYFGKTELEPTYPYKLTVVIEGFRGNKVFRHPIEFPVTISAGRTLVLSDVLINGEPNYYFMFESIGSINLSVILKNQGFRVIEWAIVDFYIGKELIGRRYVELLLPGGATAVNVSTFRYLTPGIYNINVFVRYKLPEGVEDYVNASGIIEVFRGVKVTLSSDKTSVIEGSNVLFEGKVVPGNKSFVILERLFGKSWITIDVTVSDVYGVFRFEWVAESIDPSLSYVENVFRARVPLSAVGSNASASSNIISLTVYNARRVSDFISDLTLSIEPDRVFEGHNTTFKVRITPTLPVCVPVKITYLDPSIYVWFELGSMYVCGGEGNAALSVKLSPGKYSVKAVIPSPYRVIESLPKPLNVLDIPKILIYNPNTLVYGSDLPVTVKLSPPITESLKGLAYLIKDSETISNTSITLSGGTADVIFRNVTREGTLTISTCVNFSGLSICNHSKVDVIKLSLSISPTSSTVDVNSPVRYTINVLPPSKYDLELSVLTGTEAVFMRRFTSDEYGRALIDVTSPSKPGSYVVKASILGTPVSASAKLDVIEFIKSITFELLNKSVRASERVYVRVNINPTPTTPQQIVISLQRGGIWDSVAYHMMTSSSATISFTAPSIEGAYKVKAVVAGSNIESNVETLTVTTAATTLLPTEYLYIIIASAAVGSILLYLRGRRR
ncbi:MAG: hypothetical protein RMH77_07485 [Sulfolobales archaeon]|nr:hypothetical protein [Sulfolobales archaeon]